MQAMILAAGMGTRLLPHTLVRPKPLFPILNQPLLLLTVKRLQRLGFDHIVVNCHHLKHQVVKALAGLEGVIVLQEEVILGTGGGLRNALAHLRQEPLFVSNGDLYHTVDIVQFYHQHLTGNRQVTLAMHDYPRFNNVLVAGDRVVSFDERVESSPMAFTGLHVIEPEVLTDIEAGRPSCIIDHYRKILQEGEQIACYRVDDCFWTDMGTMADYLALHEGLLTNTVPCWPEAGPRNKPFCVSRRARLPADFTARDWVCIGDAHVGEGTRLERVVVWDDVSVGAGTVLADTIISSDQP